MGANKEAITVLLAKYNDALIASNTDAVMPLYAEDGVQSVRSWRGGAQESL